MNTQHYSPWLGFSKNLWKSSNNDTVLLESPFIISLVAGNLNRRDFHKFVSNEISILNSYVLALKLTQKYALEDEKVQLMDKVSLSILITEMNTNRSMLIKNWGAECNGLPEGQETEICKDFILQASSGMVGGFQILPALETKATVTAYTLVAMLPHFQLLEFLAEKIRIQLDARYHHQFKDWFEYCYKSSSMITHTLEYVVDDLYESMSTEAITSHFCQALKLEQNLVLGLSTTLKSFVPLLKKKNNPSDRRLFLCSSFFSTCTEPITKDPLFRLDFGVSVDSIDYWGLRTREDSPLYEKLVEARMSHLSAVKTYNYSILRRALEILSLDEKDLHTSTLIETGFFEGLSSEDIKQDGERLIFRDGCLKFFKNIGERKDINANIHVISYCWCRELIQSAFSSGDLHDVNIHSNLFTYQGTTSTGVVRRVESAVDKLNTFETILHENFRERTKLTVYIGESISDLLCLLKADIGIVIGSNMNLRRLGGHYGVTFVPLFDMLVEKQKELIEEQPDQELNEEQPDQELNEEQADQWIEGSLGIVYTVSCWAQVQSFLVGS